jgi:hypothetical protein
MNRNQPLVFMSAEKRGPTLSKTAFIRSLQCLKSLYLYKNYYMYRDKPSPQLLARLRAGIKFGKLAWKLFPKGIDVHPFSFSSLGVITAAKLTQEYLSAKNITLFEASTVYHQAINILDILEKRAGKVYAYEVKSSVLISETYILDAAFQYYVMKGAGYEPKQFSIIHLNEGYDASSREIESLNITDVTEKLVTLQDYIEENISKAFDAFTDDTLLQIQQGEQCNNPYPCDFSGYCTRFKK